MPKKVKLKTRATQASVANYLNQIEPATARSDAKQLAKLFKSITGNKPKMWGPSIIGYGEYTYHRANGDQGTMLATGFSARKSGPVLYVMAGYEDCQDVLDKLGPHKLGKSCLYLKNLEGIDMDALASLIQMGLEDLKRTHKVKV